MTFGRALATALGVAAMVTAAAPVRATTAEDEAYALYQAAAEDFDRRDFEAALEKLDKAYALFPKGIIQVKKAEALENLGRIEEAHAVLQGVVPDEERVAQKVQTGLRRLEVALARPVSVSILTGALTGARIFVDGTDTGEVTPSVLELRRGLHAIRLEKPGYAPFVVEAFDARGVETLVLEASLSLVTGRVRILIEDGTFADATVTLDGAPLPGAVRPTAPGTSLEVTAGPHALTCERKGRVVLDRRVEVPPDQEITVVCPAPGGGGRAAGWTLLGVGAAAAGVGTYWLVSYFDDKDYARRTNQRLESNKQIFGPVAMGVGVGAIVTSAVLLARAGGGDPRTERDLAPVAAPARGGAVLGLSGRF